MSATFFSRRTSDASANRRRVGRPPSRMRHNQSDMPIMDEPISDRKHLFDLRNWVNELHEKRSYRWIASHTWRGDKSFGWWERVSKSEHLKPRPTIRPRVQDWYDVQLLRRTVRDFADADSKLFDAALAIVEARAQLDLKVAALLSLARKLTGEKV